MHNSVERFVEYFKYLLFKDKYGRSEVVVC